nr:RNA-directed DNA polymerase, eukaryota [Tanacetum cinerariifolium]
SPDLDNDLEDDSSSNEESVGVKAENIHEGKKIDNELDKDLEKKDKEDSKIKDPIFPPGFTHVEADKNGVENNEKTSLHPNDNMNISNICTSSIKSGRSRFLKIKLGGSLLDVMEDLIEAGQTMGYNMEGCMKNFKDIVGVQGEQHVVK